MSVWYVKEISRLDELFDKKKSKLYMKISYSIKKMFNKLTIKQVQDKTICILPILESDKEINNKKIFKLAKKINKRVNDRNIVLSNYLNNQIELKNELYSNNLNILDGRWLFSLLLGHTIEYISKKQQREVEKQEVSVFINNDDKESKLRIIDIAKKVKMLNVVTSDIKRFKNIEEYLHNNLGILIRVTNNTKKALLKSNIIINLDFPEEFVNNYKLPKKAVIVNVGERIKIYSKKFSGININYYNINVPVGYVNDFKLCKIYHKFDSNILYESILYGKAYDDALEVLNENKSKIVNLVGEKGIIDDSEFKIEENLEKYT